MKTIVLFFFLFCSHLFYAATIKVNNSGQTGTYTTISAAITAAIANDTIQVSPYGFYSESITIDKSLTIESAIAGVYVTITGSCTITSAPQQKVILIGLNFGGLITGNTGACTLNNVGEITICDCKSASNCTINSFIDAEILFSQFSGWIKIYSGKIIANLAKSISITDGPNIGVGDTLFIIANKIESLNWTNDDNIFYISNNYLSLDPGLGSTLSYAYIYLWHYSTSVNNNFINNTITDVWTGTNAYGLYINPTISTLSTNNLYFINNIVQKNISIPSSGTTYYYAFYNASSSSYGIPKNYYNTYQNSNTNYLGEYLNVDLIDDPISLNSNGGSSNILYVVDKGVPSLEHYDIDLTINDRGAEGGPNSILNYWSTNASGGRARVYELNIPIEIWNGTSPNISAGAVHKN